MPTIFTRKGYPLGGALVDNVHADLGKTIDVGLPGAVISAFNGVVKEAINAVSVVLVILRCVDAPLSGI